MADEVTELLVRIKADIAGLQSSLEQAKRGTEEASGNMAASFKRAGEALLEVFAVSKVVGFVKDSMEAFAKYERAYQNLANTIENSGTSWAKVKDQVANYLEEVEKTTRFSKDEVVTSLQKIVFLTKDYGASLTINNMAMDLAVRKNIGLESASQMLALAYQGNTRGLSQMARALGISGDKAKDVGYLFKQLTKQTYGASKGEDNLATSFDKMKHSMDEWVRYYGETFGKIYLTVGKWMDQILDWFAGGKGKSVEEGARNQIQAIYEMHRKAYKAMYDQGKITIAEFHNAMVGEDLAREKRLKALDEQSSKEKKASDDRERLERDGVAKHAKLMQDKLKGDEKVEKATTKLTDEQLREQLKTAEQVGKGMEKVWERASGEMVKDFKAGTLTTKKVFEDLGKAVGRALIDALADALEQQGVKMLVTAMGNSLDPFSMFAAPGEFAAAAELEAAAGTMKGVAAAYLAEGGIVTQPTLIVAGEAGPERITPLSKENMGGDQTFHVQINLPHVQKPDDFARAHMTIERALAKASTSLKYRTGNRQGAL